MSSNSDERAHLAAAAAGSKSESLLKSDGKAIDPGSHGARLAVAEVAAAVIVAAALQRVLRSVRDE